jgi:hypothetical protein
VKVTRRVARGSLATLAVAAVAVTAACGSGVGKSTVRVAPTPNSEAGKTGPQVLADAARALATVPTVHVVGTTTDGDSKLTMKVDVQAQADGGDGSMQSSAGSLEMRFVKGHLYYKGTAGFFEATMEPKSAAEKMAGHWIYEDIVFGQDPPLTPKGLSEEIGNDDGVTVEPGVTNETLDGQRVVVVRESDGSRMDVAATGAPLPLKISGTGAGDSGFAAVGNVTLTYGEAPVQLQVPAGAVSMPDQSFGALPSGFPTAFPSNFMSLFPSGIPTDFPSELPSGFPTALASQLRSLAAAHGGATAGRATPTPTP